MKKIIFLFTFILINLSYSADINSTIVTGDKNLYIQLTTQLDKNQTKDILDLQKTLLTKLIELSSPYKEENLTIKTPATQNEYQNLFEEYLNWAIQKSNHYNQLLKNQKDLLLMEKEIKDDININLTKQLFYAFYDKNIKFLKRKISQIDNYLLKYQKNFITALPKITFDKKEIEKNLNSWDKKLQDLNQQENIIKLKIEQSKLINSENRLKHLKDQIDIIKKSKYKYFQKKLEFTFLLFSKSLKKKNKKTFDYKKDMLDFIEKHHKAEYTLIESDLKKLFTAMEKAILGSIKTFEGESYEEIKNQALKIWNIMNKPLFSINKTPLSIFKLIIALLIFIIGFFIAKIYKHYINNISLKSKTITESTKTLLSNLGHYFIFLVTFFIVLKVLGIDLSSIALVAGALSVGIGFGLQNIISNFVSGIILMLERSVKIGDYIEIDENTRGRVTDIKMRSITVNTNSNIDITIPNQSLIENQVTNWSMNDKIKRFEIPFGVAYGTSPQKVIDVILKAIEDLNCKNILKTKDRHTRVIMTGMGSSSVDFELFIWIAGKDIFYPKRTTSKFLILIYNTLYENNIEIPFPQQDLHIKSIEKDIPIIIKKEI